MKITIRTASNDKHMPHIHIAQLIKRGLATFRLRKEGNKIVVRDMERDMILTVEETDVEDDG